MSKLKVLDEVWYEKGLRFKCTGCGKCCTGAPGYVWLQESDIKRLSKRLNLSREAFLRSFARQIGSRYSLKEDTKTYDCIFLKGKQCTAYEDRPKQCQTYPFWPDLLQSEKAWIEEKTRCEGIDHPDATLLSKNDIEKQCD